MEETYKITKKMSETMSRFYKPIKFSVSFDMWEKIAKVFPQSKRKIHYDDDDKLIK
jgi:hypothetical protein